MNLEPLRRLKRLKDLIVRTAWGLFHKDPRTSWDVIDETERARRLRLRRHENRSRAWRHEQPLPEANMASYDLTTGKTFTLDQKRVQYFEEI